VRLAVCSRAVDGYHQQATIVRAWHPCRCCPKCVLLQNSKSGTSSVNRWWNLMWWTVLIAVAVALTQAFGAWLGWRVTVHPPDPQNRGLRRVYEAGFIAAALITIVLVGLATYRQGISSRESSDAVMLMGRKLTDLQTITNHKLDTLYALLETRLDLSPPTSKIPAKAPQVKPQTPPPTTLPATATLTISQSPKVSSRADAEYETEVVVQTTTEILSVKLLVQCNKDLVAVTSDTSMVAFMVREGILRDHPNVFLFSYASAQPPFGPAHPLVFDVWSKEPITCNQAATF